jgi:hypothetical protein
VDKYLVSLAFMLLCFECGWLLQDLKVIDISKLAHFSQNRNEDGEILLGKITLTKKEVRLRSTSSLVWEETQSTQKLFAYDSVLTLDQSGAELDLKGSAHVTLHENTLVTIEPPFEKSENVGSPKKDGPVRLHFKHGTMLASSGREPQSVDTGDYVIEAQSNSKITVRSRGDGGFDIESSEGQAKIIDPKTQEVRQTLNSGQAVQIKDKTIAEAQEALNVKWDTPADGYRYYTHNDITGVDFKWSGEVTSLDLFQTDSNRLQSYLVKDMQELKVQIAVGNYIARLQSGTQSTFARNISVWHAPRIHLVKPLIRERFKVNTPIKFIWTLDSDVAQYIFEISKDLNFEKIIKSEALTENAISINELALGKYFWRVRGKDNLKYEIPELYNNTFMILNNPLEPPKLKAPLIKHDSRDEKPHAFNFMQLFFDEAMADELKSDYSAEFQWEQVREADGYLIEISATPDFRETLISESTKQPTFRWKNFKLAKYYWRVAARTTNGDVGLFSEVGYADLRKIPTEPVSQVPIPVKTVEDPATATATQMPGEKVESIATAKTFTPHEVDELSVKQKPPSDQWVFDFASGGYAVTSLFKGGDFKVQETGLSLGVFKVRLAPPSKWSPWHFEGEFRKIRLKAQDPTSYPFQDQTQNYQMRLAFIKNSNDYSKLGYGFAIQNEVVFYHRLDLENVGGYSPLLVGAVASWSKISFARESNSQLGFFVGEAAQLDWRFWISSYLHLSRRFSVSLTPEVRLSTGVTKDLSWFYDAKGIFWLGVHW